jgi:hypothetical protein
MQGYAAQEGWKTPNDKLGMLHLTPHLPVQVCAHQGKKLYSTCMHAPDDVKK